MQPYSFQATVRARAVGVSTPVSARARACVRVRVRVCERERACVPACARVWQSRCQPASERALSSHARARAHAACCIRARVCCQRVPVACRMYHLGFYLISKTKWLCYVISNI